MFHSFLNSLARSIIIIIVFTFESFHTTISLLDFEWQQVFSILPDFSKYSARF